MLYKLNIILYNIIDDVSKLLGDSFHWSFITHRGRGELRFKNFTGRIL